MNIGFYYVSLRLSVGNGIISQAMTWKRGLESCGHNVTLCTGWEYYKLQDFDAIQIFGVNESSVDMIRAIRKHNDNIFLAPILDPDYGLCKAWLKAHYGGFKFRLSNRFSALKDCSKLVKGVLIRSEFEKSYMMKAFGYKENQCYIVRLPSGVSPDFSNIEKEPFCFHMSLLCDPRKNVKRLVDAAIKYNFRLVLAGGLRNDDEKRKLHYWIDGHDNIEYRGFITEEEKLQLYRSARVFALPSTNEGVGIVALEAACYGADIVITKLGGPKEYYDNLAAVVDPYSVDEIGMAIKSFIEDKISYQPQLAKHIDSLYSLTSISKQLEEIYENA